MRIASNDAVGRIDTSQGAGGAGVSWTDGDAESCGRAPVLPLFIMGETSHPPSGHKGSPNVLHLSPDATSDIVVGDGGGLLCTTHTTQPLHSCDAICNFTMLTSMGDCQPRKAAVRLCPSMR